MNFIPRMITTVALGALASISFGQLNELRSTKDGTGQLSFRSRSSNSTVRVVAVNLRKDGFAEVRIVQGGDETFSGSWKNDGNRRCVISITRLSGDRASGGGTLEHDGRGGLTRVALNGSVGSARYSLDFRASTSGGDWGGDYTEMRATRDGSGSLTYRTRSSNSNVSRMTIWLKSNHEFEIKPQPGSDTFRGRWWADGSRRARLDFDRVGNDRASGTGSVELDGRNSFTNVSFSGNVDSARFSLTFRASNGDDGGSVGNKELIYIARRAVKTKFSDNTSFDFYNETAGDVVFGQRLIKGELKASGGNRPGRYRYTVTLGAGTNAPKNVTYTRIYD